MRGASFAIGWPRWLEILLAVLAAASVIGFLRDALTLDMRFVFGTEGWNAYHAAQAATGQNPYPAPGGLFYNNYPPLGFYIVGWLGRLTGDTLVAGRLVSLLAFAGLALGVAGAARQMGCARREAAFAALLFATILLFDYTYVGLNDPQILGQAVQIPGLILVLRGKRSRATMALAAFFFSAAVFTKHSLVVQPLVAVAWLLATDRRNGLRLALFGAAFAVIGILGFQAVFDRSLWSQLHDPRIWRLEFSVHALLARTPEGLVPLAASLALLKWFRHDKYVVFCVSYLIVSLLVAAYFLGGAGVGSKALYDAVIALSLCGGIGVGRLGNRMVQGLRARPLYAALHFLPAVGLIAYHAATGTLPPHWQSARSAAVVDTARDIAFLKARPGPALCNALPLCFWAGKPATVDLWGYEQAVATGARDGRKLREAIRQHRYGVLQLAAPPDALGAPPEVRGAYSASISRAIEADYRIARTSHNGTFWVPKK